MFSSHFPQNSCLFSGLVDQIKTVISLSSPAYPPFLSPPNAPFATALSDSPTRNGTVDSDKAGFNAVGELIKDDAIGTVLADGEKDLKEVGAKLAGLKVQGVIKRE